RDQQVVQVASAFGWIALDQREVFGSEQHGAQRAEDVPSARYRGPVDPCTVGLAGRDLDLKQSGALDGAVGVHDGSANNRAFGAQTDQRGVLGHSVTAQSSQVPERLD